MCRPLARSAIFACVPAPAMAPSINPCAMPFSGSGMPGRIRPAASKRSVLTSRWAIRPNIRQLQLRIRFGLEIGAHVHRTAVFCSIDLLAPENKNPHARFAQDAETQSCMQPKSDKRLRMAKPGFKIPRVQLRKNLCVSASWREPPSRAAHHAVMARWLRAAPNLDIAGMWWATVGQRAGALAGAREPRVDANGRECVIQELCCWLNHETAPARFAQDAEAQSCMQPKSDKRSRMAKPGFKIPESTAEKSWRLCVFA